MASKVVKGIDETIKELRKFGKDAEKMINEETEAAANAISLDAKQRAPKNFGKLAQSISIFQPISARGKGITTYGVYVNELYGAYMEFGTGAKVKVPAEFDSIAKSFMGKKVGTFTQFIEAMTIYFKAKGYDTKYVWIACVNKINNGMNPHPFLYPAWIKGKSDYLKNLNKLVSHFNKKI